MELYVNSENNYTVYINSHSLSRCLLPGDIYYINQWLARAPVELIDSSTETTVSIFMLELIFDNIDVKFFLRSYLSRFSFEEKANTKGPFGHLRVVHDIDKRQDMQ